MPIIKSAKKALRQSEKRKKRNLKRKEAFRDVLKKIKKLAAAKELEKAKQLVPLAYKALDKAAKTGVVKKNMASRKKSKLMKVLARASK
ncbi:MAG: 30S ribosomal protein S20 [Parcubacteria group bacterium GW2011_GWB1_41_6]|nr:MAG: 30S ribosomal protein S20 [Parcubacteria group bacterium GW2011_GWB1_41_6]KKS33929.1 MAG: 30S ribosomal protein S20 [Parcubacteria group bacterium GW2011_GWC2_42_13]